MRQSFQVEILDRGNVPEHLIGRAYQDLTNIHRFLGDTRSLVAAIRRDPLPVRRILDIGCGHGGVLRDIQRRLALEVLGVDLNPPADPDTPFPILRADAIRHRLPPADLAFSMYLTHHLSPGEIVSLVQNVGRSCRRFLIYDLIRHPVPLALFRLFVVPLISPIAGADGCVSIRRSYTPRELARIADRALDGTGARIRHSVAPFYVRQVRDITYPPRSAHLPGSGGSGAGSR